MLVRTHLKSLSDKVSGDSIAIFIRCERLISPRRLRSLVLISFIRENDLSTDAVPIGSDKQQQASLCRFGSSAIKVSLVANSCSCFFKLSLGCLDRS